MSHDDVSGVPGDPRSPAERLLAMAEESREDRAGLVERWSRAESWSPLEGIALAWSIDPKLRGSGYQQRQLERELPGEARHYLALAHRSSDLTRERITPLRFITWAERVGLAFHPDWRRAIDRAALDASRSRVLDEDRKTRALLIRRWARAPYWSLEEGVVLAYGLDPNEAVVRRVTGYDQPSIRASADAQHLLVLARRAVSVGALQDEATPFAFMTWARSMGVEFHTDWWAAVADQIPSQIPADPPPDPPAGPDLKTKEQETLLKMVAAMAMAYYGWDRDALRNVSTAEIASDLQEAGVSLDPDTIRKWLKRSADLIPRQGA